MRRFRIIWVFLALLVATSIFYRFGFHNPSEAPAEQVSKAKAKPAPSPLPTGEKQPNIVSSKTTPLVNKPSATVAPDPLDAARQRLREIETTTYGENPYLKFVEEYRKTANQWGQTQLPRLTGPSYFQSDDPKESRRRTEVYVQMSNLMGLLILEETSVQDPSAIPLLQTVFDFAQQQKGLGMDMKRMKGVDQEIGYTPASDYEPEVLVDFDTFLDEIRVRKSLIEARIQSLEDGEPGLDHNEVNWMRVKTTAHGLVGLADAYIDLKTPQELADARQQVRMLENEAANKESM